MSASAEWIVNTYRTRKHLFGPSRGRAAQIAATYEGATVTALPEMDLNEQAAIANLLTQGLDQMAMRIASVQANIQCPPLVPGQKRSEANAAIRRRANLAWWHENRWDRKQRKRARWLIGYASSPVVIRPDRKRQIPIWELRDPLCSYPSSMPETEDLTPDNDIFAFHRSLGWIAERWPQAARALNPANSPNLDDRWEVLEYCDAEEHVMVVIGKPHSQPQTGWGSQRQQVQGAPFVELERFPNLVGRCPVINPTRLSLNHPQGQFDQLPGLYQIQARLMSLYIIGAERSIFPDTWFVSRPNETVQIVERPDGRAGIPGLVKGGDLKEVNVVPPPQIQTLIDQIERNARVTASISQDFGGEAPSNTRTARAGEQLLSATVDFWVQEAQETLGAAYELENQLAVAVSKAYFGSAKKSFYVRAKGAQGPVDYTPSVNFDSEENVVSWPLAGSDANSMVVGIGQRLGLKEMSVRTAQEKDPYIDDPELEHERITTESLEQALLASIDQAVAAGQLGPLEVSRLLTLVGEGKESLADAFNRLHQETQQQQVGAGAGGLPGGGGPPGGVNAPQGAAPGGPGGPNPNGGNPAPGIMAPGLQQQLGVGPMNPPGGGVPTPPPGAQHMSQVLKMLRAS